MAGDQDPRDDEAPRRDVGRELRVALAFLTRLRVGVEEFGPGALARAGWAFPVVGAIVGLVGGLAYALVFKLGLAPWPAAIAAVAAQLLLTGALHEDGLADTADGFGAGETRERKLKIMRDARIGTYGVAALTLVLAARVGAIADLSEPKAVVALLIAAGAVSRSGVVVLMGLLAPARADGLSARAGRADGRTMAIASVLAVVMGVLALGFGAASAGLVAVAAATGAVGVVAVRQIGGQTGDVLGAAQQAGEVAFLLAIVAQRGP